MKNILSPGHWSNAIFILIAILAGFFLGLYKKDNIGKQIVDCYDPVMKTVSGGQVIFEYSGSYVISGGTYFRQKWGDGGCGKGSTSGVTCETIIDSGYKEIGDEYVVNKQGCIPRNKGPERRKKIIDEKIY